MEPNKVRQILQAVGENGNWEKAIKKYCEFNIKSVDDLALEKVNCHKIMKYKLDSIERKF